jgi:hypothetical protein
MLRRDRSWRDGCCSDDGIGRGMLRQSSRQHRGLLGQEHRIEGYRAKNTEKLLRPLDLLYPGWSGGRWTELTAKAEWMLANHILREVTQAARSRGRARASEAPALRNDLPNCPRSIVRHVDSRLDTVLGGLPEKVISVESDMPIIALTTTVLDVTRSPFTALVRDSIGCVATTRFGQYLDPALWLVVLLRRRQPGEEEYDNGSNETFSCTIYADYLDDPYLPPAFQKAAPRLDAPSRHGQPVQGGTVVIKYLVRVRLFWGDAV